MVEPTVALNCSLPVSNFLGDFHEWSLDELACLSDSDDCSTIRRAGRELRDAIKKEFEDQPFIKWSNNTVGLFAYGAKCALDPKIKVDCALLVEGFRQWRRKTIDEAVAGKVDFITMLLLRMQYVFVLESIVKHWKEDVSSRLFSGGCCVAIRQKRM